MPTRSYNHLVIDLNKAAYAWFYYRNQHGEVLRTKPTKPTCHCVSFDPDEMVEVAGADYLLRDTISLMTLAVRRRTLDHWYPVVRFRMTCSDVLEFTNDKATSLWDAWCAKQFGKKAKKK